MPTHTAHDVLQHIARLEREAARIARLHARDDGHRSARPANAARKPRRRRRHRR